MSTENSDRPRRVELTAKDFAELRAIAGVVYTPKAKGGRPPAQPGLRRVNVPLRLPEWLVQWMAEQPETPAELIEAALLKAHKLRPPRAP